MRGKEERLRYIENLTGHLIRKNGYEDVLRRLPLRGEFLKFVKGDLERGDLRKMRPETLGKIMGSFEIGDVGAANERELFQNVRYSGDCEDTLRELVAACLAFLIRDLLTAGNTPCFLPPSM